MQKGMGRWRADSALVLVHSPLVGPSTWAPVARELERSDRRAVVPSLLGVSGAPQPRWRRCVDAAIDATEAVSGPLVVVGHSAAGALLPAIADALSREVTGLIFVDAVLPPARGGAPLVPPDLRPQLRALASDGVLPPWSTWFGPDGIRELVPDDAVRATLEKEMPRLPLALFEASVPVPEGWDRHGGGYLLLSPDQYGDSAADARGRGWPVAEIPRAHHLTLVTDPDAVAGELLRLEDRLPG
jgi:hypothetical protein